MTQGSLHLVAKATALVRLRQTGCLKLRFPKPQHSAWLEPIALNNSGGVVAGDQLSTYLQLGPRAQLAFTTASAEKIYRAARPSSPAKIVNTLHLERETHAEWLPQETILFNSCSMKRELHVEIAATATLLGVESLVFGRVASGEILQTVYVTDLISIRREGQTILHDAWRPPPDFTAVQGRASLAGARAIATLFRVAPDAGIDIPAARDILAAHPGVEAGVSAWDGMMLIRMLAAEPHALRAAIAALLHHLRNGRMLPKPWIC